VGSPPSEPKPFPPFPLTGARARPLRVLAMTPPEPIAPRVPSAGLMGDAHGAPWFTPRGPFISHHTPGLHARRRGDSHTSAPFHLPPFAHPPPFGTVVSVHLPSSSPLSQKFPRRRRAPRLQFPHETVPATHRPSSGPRQSSEVVCSGAPSSLSSPESQASRVQPAPWLWLACIHDPISKKGSVPLPPEGQSDRSFCCFPFWSFELTALPPPFPPLAFCRHSGVSSPLLWRGCVYLIPSPPVESIPPRPLYRRDFLIMSQPQGTVPLPRTSRPKPLSTPVPLR